MISRPQQILLKRAQQQAALDDSDYRSAIESVTSLPGCRSSKDPRLTDAHIDNLLSYFEAIYWRGVDSGILKEPCNPNAVFRQRGYWAAKNQRGNTSRDRFTDAEVAAKIHDCEQRMFAAGYGFKYCQAILSKTGSAWGYIAAMERTLSAKRNSTAPKASPENVPF